MTATLPCLDALNCDFKYEFKQAGLVALSESGELVPQETLASIRQNRIVLKWQGTGPYPTLVVMLIPCRWLMP